MADSTGGNNSGDDPVVPQNLDENVVLVGQLKAAYKEVTAEVERLKNQSARLNDLSREANDETRTNVTSVKEQLAIENDLIETKQRQINAALSLLANGEELEDQALIALDLSEKSLETIRDQKNSLAAQSKELAKLNKQLRLQQRYFNQIDTQVESTTEAVTGLGFNYENSFLKALVETRGKNGIDGIQTGFQRITQNLKGIIRPSEIFYSFAKRILTETVSYNKQLYEARINLAKNTGMASEFADNVERAGFAARRIGVNFEELGTITGGLINNFSDFTIQQEDTSDNLIKTAAQLTKLGVSTEDFSTSLTVLTRNLGYTADEASGLTKDVVTFGQSIGVVPSKIVKDFATAIPKLEIYGKRGIDMFRRLELQAKASGIGIDGLLSVAEGFDTFEGAADIAGKLNAAFQGAYFDPMELALASEEERLEILKETINSMDVQFDQMTRFERKMITGIIPGLETAGEVQRFLNGETDKFSETQKGFNKLLGDTVSIADQLAASFQTLAVGMQPAIEGMKTFMNFITDDSGGNAEIKMGSLAISILVLIPLFVALLLKLSLAMAAIAVVVGGLLTIGAFSLVPGPDENANGVDNYKGGMSIVGEKGPEMITMGPGTNVLTNQNTGIVMASLLAAVDRLGNANDRPIELVTKLDGKTIAKSVYRNSEFA